MKVVATNKAMLEKYKGARKQITITVAGKLSDNLLMQCRKCASSLADEYCGEISYN